MILFRFCGVLEDLKTIGGGLKDYRREDLKTIGGRT
jgi:hypothetical protein